LRNPSLAQPAVTIGGDYESHSRKG
jgi:hypothetical protein